MAPPRRIMMVRGDAHQSMITSIADDDIGIRGRCCGAPNICSEGVKYETECRRKGTLESGKQESDTSEGIATSTTRSTNN